MIRAPPWIHTATGKGSRVAGRITFALIAQSPTVLYVYVSRRFSDPPAATDEPPAVAQQVATDPPRNARLPRCRPIAEPSFADVSRPTSSDCASPDDSRPRRLWSAYT